MIVQMTLEVTLELPDGSASIDMTGGRGWLLPNGDWVKPWVSLELNDERDLTHMEALKMGCNVSDMVTSVEVVNEAI